MPLSNAKVARVCALHGCFPFLPPIPKVREAAPPKLSLETWAGVEAAVAECVAVDTKRPVPVRV